MEEFFNRYNKVPERIRYIALAGTCLAMVALHYWIFYTPQQDILRDFATNYAKLETTRAEKHAYADNLPKYVARYNELQQSLSAARAMLPDNADVPQFLATLGNIASNAGAVIDRIEPKEELAKEFYAEIAFNLKARGSYHDIASFIDQISRLDRIVTITDITMTAPKVESQKVVVSSTFAVKTYRFLETKMTEVGAKSAAPKTP